MKKVFLRADAGYGIGYGHFIRTLALADVLKEEFECTFYTTTPTDYELGEMAKVCPYVALKEETKFDAFLDSLKGDEIVVLDNYFFTTEYQKQIKEKGCKLVCIDDMHDKHYVADAVINHTPGTLESQFSKENYTKLFLGPGFLLLRKEFREATRSYTSFKEKKNVYVCYGGSDELNFTRRACEIIINHVPRHIDVVVGGAYEFYDDLQDFAKGKDITIYRNITSAQIVNLLQESCLAVVPDSMVFFEACCLRRPIICGYDCDNQMFISQYNQNNGLGCEIGDMLENFDEKFAKAYREMNITVAVNYVYNQKALINDTAENLINIFKSL
jgi:UDP-2,4-diacetamido-2,4,6-trideoxy-beta-L-altropyranose hydrolase